MRPTVTANDLFSTQGRVDVLRLMWSVEIPMTAAEAARRTRMSHPAASAVLWALADLGVLQSAPAGRGATFWLNRHNVYVAELLDPLFSAEERIPDIIVEALRQYFAEHTEALALFGSYARGDQTPQSDVDVVAVTQDDAAKKYLEADLLTKGSAFRKRFGATLSPLVYDKVEAAALAVRAPGLYESLLADGISVTGPSVAEWTSLWGETTRRGT